MSAHNFKKYRSLSWQVCCLCGLVCLRNQRTERAIRAACPGLLDK